MGRQTFPPEGLTREGVVVPNFAELPQTVAIVGSRDFPRCDVVRRLVHRLNDGSDVVSGGARGVDRAAEEAARARGWSPTVYLPDTVTYGVPWAFFERNSQIVAHTALAAGVLFAFCLADERGWITSGTADSLAHCHRMRVPYVLYRMKEDQTWLPTILSKRPQLKPTWLPSG